MDMTKKDFEEGWKRLDESRRRNKRQKKIIIGLSVALLLVGATAITVPLVVNATKGNSPTPSPTPTTKKYKVTFDTGSGGSKVTTQEIEEGKCAYKPETPTRTGYDFVQWNGEDGLIYNFDTPITHDTTIKAAWKTTEVTTVTITFDAHTYDGKNYGSFTTGQYFTMQVNKLTPFKEFALPTITPDDDHETYGWSMSDGSDVDLNLPISQPTTYHARYKETTKFADISFATSGIEGNTYKVTHGQSTMTLTKGTKWENIDKNTLPSAEITASSSSSIPTFVGWSLDKQTSEDQKYQDHKIPDTKEFKDKETLLYPWFDFDKETKIITINIVKKNDDQKIEGGISSVDVPYKPDSTDSGIIKTFAEVNKPQVTEKLKVFEGYYHTQDCAPANKWSNDEKITPELVEKWGGKLDVYVNMVEYDDNISVKFEVPADVTNYIFTGSSDIKTPRGKTLSELAPQVYRDYSPNPEAKYGYKSDYYLSGWADKSTGKVVPNDTILDSNITLVAQFKEKVTFKFEDSSPAFTTKVDPNCLWRDVSQGQPIQQGGKFFVGWQAPILNGQQVKYVDVDENTKISSLYVDENNVCTIKPKYIEDENYYLIKVSNTAKVDNGDGSPSERADMIYKGNYVDIGGGQKQIQYAVIRNEEVDTYFKNINRPFVPCADNAGGETYNQGIKFSDKWELKNNETNGWDPITDDTVIPKTTAAKAEFEIRPVVSQHFDITFDPNGGTIKSGESNTYTITSSTPFKNIKKPNIIAADGYKFVGWTYNGNLVEQSTTFDFVSSGITLKASYKTDEIQTKINYHIFQDELDDTKFPATPINSANSFPIVKSDTSSSSKNYKYSEFDHIAALRPYYKQTGWVYEDTNGKLTHGGKKYTMVKDNVVIKAGECLDLYAWFEAEANYVKMDIAKTSPFQPGIQYTITGETSFYAQVAKSFPFNENTGQIEGFDISIKAVGYEIDYWTDSDGNKLDKTKTVADHDYTVVPHFKSSKRSVTFSNNDDQSIKFTDGSGNIAREIPYYDHLLEYLEGTKSFLDPNYPSAPTVKKERCDFKCWAIKQGNEYKEVTADTVVESNITLVPIFYEESVYEYSERAFYFDETKGEWAVITSYTGGSTGKDSSYLTVKYTDGTSNPYVNKATFNYEIRLGKSMTKLPDYFMAGCSSWNNGGLPLKLPNSIIEIGKNVMYGCSSFNQKITFTALKENLPNNKGYFLKIGENFMRDCFSFNSDITLGCDNKEYDPDDPSKWVGIMVSPGFMFDCISFNKTIYLPGWSIIRDYDNEPVLDCKNYFGALAVSDKHLYETRAFKFNVEVSKFKYGTETFDLKEWVEYLFPELNGKYVEDDKEYLTPYRLINVTSKLVE